MMQFKGIDAFMTKSNWFDSQTILDDIRRWVEIETPTDAPEQVNRLVSLVADHYRDLPVMLERIAGPAWPKFLRGWFDRHAFGERNTAPPDANEEQITSAVIFFDNFRRKTSQCAIDARAIHDASFLDEFHVCARILTRSAVSCKASHMIYRIFRIYKIILCIM